MSINFSNGPYYDDFDPQNNFYRVLFKPGYAVQARELNQLQSILQHQISSVGNHLFKKNTVVIPGGISLSEKATLLGIDNITDPSTLIGTTITNAPSFDFRDSTTFDNYITALVLAYTPGTVDTPAVLYVKYLKSQADGRATFQTSEQLKTVGSSLITFTVHDTIGPLIGKVATVSEGTFYTKETFVDVQTQSVIVDIYSTETLTSATVGLAVKESIVTSDDDQSLLDNSIGSPNQYAPGADRYKIELVLQSWPRGEAPTDENFIKLLDIDFNTITYLNNKTQYAELMTMLARRTYDANGNFIVNGLETAVTRSTDDEFLQATVGSGKCYLGGYEYEQLNPVTLSIEKPRGTAYQQDVLPITSYETQMMYFYIAGGNYLKEIPQEQTLIQILDSNPVKHNFDAATAVNVVGEYIEIPDHGLYTGTPLTYSSNGYVGSSGIGATGEENDILQDGKTYYAVRLTKDRIKLTTSDVGAGQLETKITVNDFDPATQIDYDTNILTIEDHGYSNGTALLYKRNSTNGTPNTVIGGLTTNKIYYVRVIDDNEFYLMRSEESAEAEEIEFIFNPTSVESLDVQNDTFKIPNHGFTTGTAVTYLNDGGASIGGLTSGNTYYVVKTKLDEFKLASSLNNATASPPVTINITTGATGQTHIITRVINLLASPAATGVNHIFDRAVNITSVGAGNHTFEKNTTVIGYGIFKYLQYSHGLLNRTDVYKMFIENITLDRGYDLKTVGGFKVITADEGAPILHRLQVDNVDGRFIAGNEIISGINPNNAGVIYNVSNDYVYVIKDANAPVPSDSVVTSIVRAPDGDNTVNGTATLMNSFISNYTGLNFIPMIKVDNDTIKTLHFGGQPSLSYSIVRRDQFSFTSGPGEYEITYTLDENQVFEEYSLNNYFAFIADQGEEQFVTLANVLEIAQNGKKYLLRVGSNNVLLGKENVWVYSTISQTNVQHAEKNVETVTNGFVIPTPSNSWMALNHQEIIGVDKIVDGKVIPILGPEDEENLGASWENGEATFITNVPHNLEVLDVVVIKNVQSSNNTDGTYDSGFNGKYVVTSVSSTEQNQPPNRFTVAMADNPGSLILQGVVALPPDINYDIDITNRYYLDTGTTEFFHGTGLIKLKKGATAPAGQISVRYTYYSSGVGEYVSIDSYGDYTGDLSYIGEVPNLIGSTKNGIAVRNYIDFRTKTSKFFFKNYGIIQTSQPTVLILRDLNLSGMESLLIGKYIVGPSHNREAVLIDDVRFNSITGNTELILDTAASRAASGIFFVGLAGESLSLVDGSGGGSSFLYPKDGSMMSYRYTKFLPKQVMIYLDRKDDVITVDEVEVKNISEVNALRKNPFKLPLAHVYMEPYTVDLHNANVTKFDNPVYQMLDIHALKLRLDRTEYYASASMDQKLDNVINGDDDDITTRAARGFWNENFTSVNTIEADDDDFQCTVYDKSHVGPKSITRTISLELDQQQNQSTWQKTGNAVTLPYKKVVALSNITASRSNNLNPFNVVQWNGKLTLNPSVDNWVDTTTIPPLTSVNTIDIPSTAVNNFINVGGGGSAMTGNVSNNVDVSIVGGAPSGTVPDQTGGTPITILPPIVIPISSAVAPVRTAAPPVKPAISTKEIVTEVNVFNQGGVCWCTCPMHSIGFSWKTNYGRVGRVNTDIHFVPWLYTNVSGTVSLLSKDYRGAAALAANPVGIQITGDMGWTGFPGSINGTFARSCVGKPYDGLVRIYLNAGRQYDRHSRAWWADYWYNGAGAANYTTLGWATVGKKTEFTLANDASNAAIRP